MEHTQEQLDFDRIASAISFMKSNFKKQPQLDEIAKHIHVSPSHFQKLFSEWAGTSPKRFLQYLSLEYAKEILKNDQITLFEATFKTGFSSTSRLHDLFVNIEGMTPAEYKKGGRNLEIKYSFSETPFGLVIVASTRKGVCYLAFENDIDTLRKTFPNALLKLENDDFQYDALKIFQDDWRDLDQIKLHLRGTDFQLKVWESLLKIPMGNMSTYGHIASRIGHPKAARAVGTAIGSNPVAFLIPCHRVIQSTGQLGGYMWGPERKTAILGWEASKKELL